MENSMMEKHKYQVLICAVLFGCDDSFVGLDLGKGLIIERKPLWSKEDLLGKIYEVDIKGLERDYHDAQINKESHEVACIYNEYEYDGDDNSARDHYDQINSELYTYIDNQVRTIRLLIEGPIRYKKLAVKMCSEAYMFEGSLATIRRGVIFPFGEAYGVQTISKAHCDSIKTLRAEMDRIAFPIEVEYLQQCHILYDRSYLITLPEAEILLITALEVLFLKSEDCKKEKLSKRCAVFLWESEEERLMCYQRIRDEYKNRSDYVHDGNARKISAEGIIFLRECVRNSLLKLLYAPQDKSFLIKNLKGEIGSVNYSVYSSEMILFMSVLLGFKIGRRYKQHSMDIIFR